MSADRSNLFRWGAPDEVMLRERAQVLLRRLRAAQLMEKPFRYFYRENAQDWLQASWRLEIFAEDYQALELGLQAFLNGQACDGVIAWERQVRESAPVTSPEPLCPAPAAGGAKGVSFSSWDEACRYLTCRFSGYRNEDLADELLLEEDLGLDSLIIAQIIEALYALSGQEGTCALDVADFPSLASLSAYFATRFPGKFATAGGEAVTVKDAGDQKSAQAPAGGGRVWRPLTVGPAQVDPLQVVNMLNTNMELHDNTFSALVGALVHKFIADITLTAPLDPGPCLFVSNHQTALEGYLFPLLAPLWCGLPLQGLTMINHGVPWADAWENFLYSHGNLPRRFIAPHNEVVYEDPWSVLSCLSQVEAAMRTGGWALHVVAEGQRDLRARQEMVTVSSVWIDLAARLNLPLVPVRFCGGAPLEAEEMPQDFPWGMGQEHIYIGQPLYPAAWSSKRPVEQKERVLCALNSLGQARDEAPMPDPAFAQAVCGRMESLGGNAVGALIAECLVRYRYCASQGQVPAWEPGSNAERLTEFLESCHNGQKKAPHFPDTPDGRWTEALLNIIFN